jgi:hypothetical protein
MQSKALNDTYDQNALLVSSNSELRMFLSFMPIKYKEYVSKLKAESNILYRQQRVSPKVIQTNDRGAEILLVDAPMSDPTVQFALRDAEYATLIDARKKANGKGSRTAPAHYQQPLHQSDPQARSARGSTSSGVPAKHRSAQTCTHVCKRYQGSTNENRVRPPTLNSISPNGV